MYILILYCAIAKYLLCVYVGWMFQSPFQSPFHSVTLRCVIDGIDPNAIFLTHTNYFLYAQVQVAIIDIHNIQNNHLKMFEMGSQNDIHITLLGEIFSVYGFWFYRPSSIWVSQRYTYNRFSYIHCITNGKINKRMMRAFYYIYRAIGYWGWVTVDANGVHTADSATKNQPLKPRQTATPLNRRSPIDDHIETHNFWL